MPSTTAIKEKSDKYSRWCPEWWTYTLYNSSNNNIYQQHIQFPPTRKPVYKCIYNGLTWLIYLILHLLQDLSILNQFLQQATQDQKLATTTGRFAMKLVPTVTCYPQSSYTKLATNNLSKNYLKPGR